MPADPDSQHGRGFVVVLYGTAFLGSFLLFQVQPLVGKAILPWFGGAAAVWTTAMLFFQIVLVAGYAFVYGASNRLSPAARSYVFMAAAVGALAWLPILPGDAMKPEPDSIPVLQVLLVLLTTVGGPYFVLSTTGPLVQDWYFRAFPSRSPYRLFALSNLGSLSGLLTYPLIVEPVLSLPTQATLWSAAYGVYVVLAAYGAWSMRGVALPAVTVEAAARKSPRGVASPSRIDARPTWRQGLVWCGFAAAGSWVMLAVTNHLCQDVASAPLLWVVPLALYLLSFILCFEYLERCPRVPFAAATLVIVPAACYTRLTFLQLAATNLAMLFVVCMLCHGELARRRPSPRYLTSYYLAIAVGGALGGLLVGIVAPLVYRRYWEWMIATVAAVLGAALGIASSPTVATRLKSWWGKTLVVGATLGSLALVGAEHLRRFDPDEVDSARNFYGVVVIREARDKTTGATVGFLMRSGTTNHGGEIFADNLSRRPTTYYGADSGIGTALVRRYDLPEPLRAGIVGLGVGTLATYGRPSDVFRFYEINPAVIQFADEYFRYLSESPAKCEIVRGDARIALEGESPQQYELLVIDAFSSDAIPTHLLTAEAFDAYLRHLRPDGMLALHVSNKHLNLTPVVAAAARRFGLTGWVAISPNNPRELQQSAEWILLTRDPQSTWWRRLPADRWTQLDRIKPVRLWTDAYSSFLPILK